MIASKALGCWSRSRWDLETRRRSHGTVKRSDCQRRADTPACRHLAFAASTSSPLAWTEKKKKQQALLVPNTWLPPCSLWKCIIVFSEVFFFFGLWWSRVTGKCHWSTTTGPYWIKLLIGFLTKLEPNIHLCINWLLKPQIKNMPERKAIWYHEIYLLPGEKCQTISTCHGLQFRPGFVSVRLWDLKVDWGQAATQSSEGAFFSILNLLT